MKENNYNLLIDIESHRREETMKKIKKLFISIKETCQKMGNRFSVYKKKNWKDTGTLLYWISIFLFSISVGLLTGTFMRPVWMGVLLISVLTFLLLIPILWILKKMLYLLFRNGAKELLSWLLLWTVCAVVMTGNAYQSGFVVCIVSATLASLVLTLLLKSLWALFHHKVYTKTICASLTLTAVVLLAVVVLLAGEGFEDAYVERYLAQDGENERARREKKPLTAQERAAFEHAMEHGPYQVLTADYGMEGDEEFTSDTIDISMFARNEGINGFFKEKYQGYSLTKVPLTGRIWYPREVSGCPTLFLIHGNHNWITDSYLGYEYLGNYLASHGYVVVSVDENSCNGLSSENDGRAVLLLENIKQVEKYNRQKNAPLYDKMDYSNLALAGHSRGGEAIALAYLFNDLDYYPDNGNYVFDYHFSIQSLIAIAPTCGQYQPSDRAVELRDVNYLLLHGANDQDVSTFMGMEQYENLSFGGEKDCIKTSIYIAGLNHGQFNSLWGKYDLAEPFNRILNVKNFLSQQEQQQIAEIFIKSFLDKTINSKPDRKENLDTLLTDCGKYTELLPETLYVQSYAVSDRQILCDFEEDARIETGTAHGVSLEAKNVKRWQEECLTFSNGERRENYAAVLQWSSKEETEKGDAKASKGKTRNNSNQEEAAEFSILLPELDLREKSLQFDLMDLREDFSEEEVEALEIKIIVTDCHGKETSLKINEYVSIYPPFPVRLNKLQYIWNCPEYKHQFQTVSIPASDFIGVDVEQVSRITLQFYGKNGRIAIDNAAVCQ